MIWVYAHKKCVEAVAFADGLRRTGHTVKVANASDYGRGQVLPCEAVVISGTRDRGRWIAEDHEAVGIPVIVIDYGYIRRVHGVSDFEVGHWQVSRARLNNPPRFACPNDRLDALGLTFSTPVKRDGVLVVGQHCGDPSHGMTNKELRLWALRACEETGGHWRPHPASPQSRNWTNAKIADGDYLGWLGKVGLVRTVCSTGGLEALIEGVAAVADAPERAAWGDLSGPVHPGGDAVKALCQRLAYGQWTLAEMRNGAAPAFVMDNLERWNDEHPL